jgi:hypothetical protein
MNKDCVFCKEKLQLIEKLYETIEQLSMPKCLTLTGGLMTKRFCKDCEHYEYHENAITCPRNSCALWKSRNKTKHHPVSGELEGLSGYNEDCLVKNANCNCPDYKEKENDG